MDLGGPEPLEAEFRIPTTEEKAAEKKPSSRSTPSKVTTEAGAEIIAFLIGCIGYFRPPYLREAWEYSPEQLTEPGERLARIMNRLPKKYIGLFDRYADPFFLATALFSLYANSTEAERQLHARYAKMVAETQTGGAAGNGSFNGNPAASANNTGGNGHHRSDDGGRSTAPRPPDIPGYGT